MASVTVRPDGYTVNTGAVFPSGDPDDATNDDDDATGITFDVNEVAILTIANPTIPAGAKLTSCVATLRGFGIASSLVTTLTALSTETGADPYVAQETSTVNNGVIYSWIAAAFAADDEVDTDTLAVWLANNAGYSISIHEVSVTVYYIAQPVVAISAPTGSPTYTDRDRPKIKWLNTFDPLGGAQFAWNVKIYDDSTFTLASVDPDTDDPYVEGAGFDGALEWRPSDPLPDDNYRVFVRTTQFGSNWSDWEYEDFTIDVDRPGVPDFTVEADAENARAILTAESNTGTVSTNGFELQAQRDGEWTDVSTLDGDGRSSDDPAEVSDYESGYGTTNYRCRAFHTFAAASDEALPESFSAWIEGTAVLTDTGWWLKHPTDPRLNVNVMLRSFASFEREARADVKQPLGRSDAVAISDTRGPETGSITIRIPDDDVLERVQAIAGATTPILLQAGTGHHEPDRWIVLGNERIERKVDRAYIDERDAVYDWTEVVRPAGTTLTVVDPLDPYRDVVLALDGLALFWEVEDADNATTIVDSSGNGNHGKMYSGQVADDSTAVSLGFWAGLHEGSSHSAFIAGSWSGSPLDQAYPGSGFRAQSYKPFVPGAKLSMFCWLTKIEEASFATIFSGSAGTGGALGAPHPTWEMGADGMMRFYANVNTFPTGWVDWGTANTGFPNSDFELNTATLIVCTYDDETGIAEWWVNDVSQGQQGPFGYYGTPIAYETAADPGYFQVGWRGGPPLFADPGNAEVYGGFIDGIAVVERILTPAEIGRLYRAGRV